MAFMFDPPKFNKDNFDLWERRMSIFLAATDYNIPDILKNGPHVPVEPETQWSEEDKKLVHLDVKIRHLISVSLPDNVFHSVMYCSTAKDMWDTLCLIYEGGECVKKTKRYNLIRQYRLFSAKMGETLTDMFNRFYGLVSALRVVGYEDDDSTLVYKFVDELPDHWDDLITCYKVNGSLDKMSLPGLYDKLLSYELKTKNRN